MRGLVRAPAGGILVTATIVAGMALVGLGVATTLIVSSPREAVLPPGCAPADRDRPGCRPITRGVSANTIALATVIATPIGAVLVALVAAATAARRQDEQLAAERERLRLQLQSDRGLQDLEEVRRVLDAALIAARDRHSELMELFERSGTTAASEKKRRAVALAGSRLLVRFHRDDQVAVAFLQVTDAISQLGALIAKSTGDFPKPRNQVEEASTAVALALQEFADEAFSVGRVDAPSDRGEDETVLSRNPRWL
jgi:hypothetical protein